MNTANRFEDRLLVELRQVVIDRPVPDAVWAARPSPATPARRGRLALTGGGLAAVTAVAAVALSSGTTPSAYAVEPHADGTVTVAIRSLADAAGLQGKLRAAGIPAVVSYAPSGCPGPGPQTGAAGSAESKPSLTTGGSQSDSTGPSHTRSGTPAKDGKRRETVTSSVRTGADGAVEFTLDPGTLKPGEKVFVSTSTGALSTVSMGIGKTNPSASAC